jgi:hypothetical protein
MISCCGLDCSNCNAYIATKTNDAGKRLEAAKEWSIMYKVDIKPLKKILTKK